MALNDTIKRIRSEVADIGSKMMTGKTIEERVEEIVLKSSNKNESRKMNLEISKEDASFISVAIMYFLSKIKYLDILTDMYPEIDVKDILTQLSHIQQLGESEADCKKIKDFIIGENIK